VVHPLMLAANVEVAAARGGKFVPQGAVDAGIAAVGGYCRGAIADRGDTGALYACLCPARPAKALLVQVRRRWGLPLRPPLVAPHYPHFSQRSVFKVHLVNIIADSVQSEQRLSQKSQRPPPRLREAGTCLAPWGASELSSNDP
jgi:hypothetical protein